MKRFNVMAALAAFLLTVALGSTSAEAKKYRHHADRVQVTKLTPYSHCLADDRYPNNCGVRPSRPENRIVRASGRGRAAISGEFTSNALVNEARKYIGTNPTGRGSLWCGAFMDLVLRHTGHKGGGNLASAYARYGTRISGPQVGAIAVMGRRGGGHVGVVSGIDPNGNPIVISGNTRQGKGPHTTLEHSYPASRIYAYVMP